MPPTSPPHEEQNPEGLPVPSEEDIQVLYEIVRSAEEHEGLRALPFRALFAAYDHVLAQRGIDTAHDRIYLRFLFRLGEVRNEGQPLQEAFEALLARLGIVIQFTDEDDEIGTIRTTESVAGAEGADSEEASSVPRRSRRASFSSFISYEEQTTREHAFTDSSASLPRTRDDSTINVNPKRAKEKNLDARDVERLIREKRLEQRNKENIKPKKFVEEIQGLQGPFGDTATATAKASRPGFSASNNLLEEPRSALSATNPTFQVELRDGFGEQLPQLTKAHPDQITPEELVAAASTLFQNESLLQPQAAEPTGTIELESQPTLEQLTQDADTLQLFHVRDLARKIIRKWRRLAVKKRKERIAMERKARDFSKRSLTNRALGQITTRTPQDETTRETEKFFAKLEKKAVRARNLYILTKAFTHWAQCAVDEQDRNSVARRHIIRMRYFNAWKEITAVNELKLRRFGLNKFFTLWRERYLVTTLFRQRAMEVYQDNLVKRTYWHWFWTFCGQRAPEYHHQRLTTRSFSRWVEVTRKSIAMEDFADDHRDKRIARHCFGRWVLRMQRSRGASAVATEFQHRHLVSRALPEWRLQLRVAPVSRRVSQMVDQRLKTAALDKMVAIVSMNEQATKLDQWRILRNAWVTWNDKLRCQALQSQIDDRLLTQFLYKWVLAERGSLLRRLNEDRLQQRILQKMLTTLRSKLSLSTEQYAAVRAGHNSRLKSNVFTKWMAKLALREQQLEQALQHIAPRMLRRSMETWHIMHEHQTRMHRWSTEASYYLRASRTIKTWREEVTQSKKDKIKNAYSQVRRTIKMNLARKLLDIWHSKTVHIMSRVQREKDVSRAHLEDQAIALLAHWRSRTAYIQSLPAVAVDHHNHNLVISTFRTWGIRFGTCADQQVQSIAFASVRVEANAYDVLRRLQLRTLEVQSLESKATTVHYWNTRRRARGILRLWAERAMHKKSPSAPSPLPSARGVRIARTRRFGDPSRSSISELPARSMSVSKQMSLGSELDTRTGSGEEQLSTPLQGSELPMTPGKAYLSTPSKRSARARALFASQVSFTPPTVPRMPGFSLSGPVDEATSHQLAGNLTSSQSSRPRHFETPLVRRLFRRDGEDSGQGPLTEERKLPERGTPHEALRLSKSLSPRTGSSQKFRGHDSSRNDGGPHGSGDVESEPS